MCLNAGTGRHRKMVEAGTEDLTAADAEIEAQLWQVTQLLSLFVLTTVVYDIRHTRVVSQVKPTVRLR